MSKKPTVNPVNKVNPVKESIRTACPNALTRLDFSSAASHAEAIRNHAAHGLAHKICLGLELHNLHEAYGIKAGGDHKKPDPEAPKWADLVRQHCGITERTAHRYRELAEHAAAAFGENLATLRNLLAPSPLKLATPSQSLTSHAEPTKDPSGIHPSSFIIHNSQEPTLLEWLADRTAEMTAGDLKEAFLACLPEPAEEAPVEPLATLPGGFAGKQKQDEAALRAELAESWAAACQDLSFRIKSDEYRRLPDPALELAADALREATIQLEAEIAARKAAQATKPKAKGKK